MHSLGGVGRRRERRRKAGLPEELTEEEQAAENAKAEAEAAAAAKRRLPAKPITKINRLRDVLVGMRKASKGEEVRAHCGCRRDPRRGGVPLPANLLLGRTAPHRTPCYVHAIMVPGA